MGAAAIGVSLWRYMMRFNPANPQWFGRDRFVLSVGHASLLQYLMLHFTGYEGWTMDEVRKYHSPSTNSMSCGHPEIEYPGIEVTTGPLGQGIANAVGMAIAGKQVAARFNKDGFEVAGQKIWCMTGDGCLQEGVGQEGELSVSACGGFWERPKKRLGLFGASLKLGSHLNCGSLRPRQPDPDLRQQSSHRRRVNRLVFHR